MNEPIHYMVLNDGQPVTKTFFDRVRQKVNVVIPALNPVERYTAEMLCGDEFWSALDNGERRLAGRCLAHMVNEDLLPLRVAESNHEYPKYYSPK